MHFFSPKTAAALLVFTLLANVMVSGFVGVRNRVDTPAAPVRDIDPGFQQAVPAGWRKIDAHGKFTFYLPPNMRDLRLGGMENYHGEYTNSRMYLTYDHEPYGFLDYEKRELKFGKGFQETQLQIDGKKSFLFLHQSSDKRNRRVYNADLYVGDLPNGEVMVQMSVSSRSPRDIETAKTIFQTIKLLASE